jgi:sugar phosphate isomerase/epimerase
MVDKGKKHMEKAKLGLIGLLGEEAKQDFWGTMERVAALGYQGIEGVTHLLQGDVAENLKRFQSLGLRVLTTSASRETLRDGLDQIIADAHALEAPRVTVWWGPCDSHEALLRDAEFYNVTGNKLRAEGLALCYHNHEHEFRTVYNGVYALDVLAEHTDPAALSFELDIAWVTFGGEDPVRVIQRFAPRVPAIHVKDLYGLEVRGEFTAIGTGVVRVQEAIQAATAAGIEWAVVEQDNVRHLTAWETVTLSALFLRETGLV